MANETDLQRLKGVITNSSFVLIGLSLVAFYYAVCGAQMWAISFLKVGVGIDEGAANIYYTIMMLTGPIFGAAFGAVLFAKIGGFASERALLVALLINATGLVVSIPVPWLKSQYAVYILMWLAVFIMVSFAPAAVAIQLSRVEPERRTQASSLQVLAQSVLGYFPAPIIYTTIVNSFPESDEQ